MFYHQTRAGTPVSHRAHVAKLVAAAEVFFKLFETLIQSSPNQAATKEYGVRLLYTEHRLFGKEEDRGDMEQVSPMCKTNFDGILI